jgi:mannose/cellobiose epimerase-like protein (N-acyl-D-glucosamine 2-epimerase family)
MTGASSQLGARSVDAATECVPVLALSSFISQQLNAAREQGIRDGLVAAGSADVVAMVDSLQAEIHDLKTSREREEENKAAIALQLTEEEEKNEKLRESEAKAWGLIAEFVDSHDHGDSFDEAQSLYNSRAALASRKTGS